MRWVPLEANPDIFQEWTGSLGLKAEDATFTDIYGLDEELLAFVPRPVYAVLMLFPVTDNYETMRKEKDEIVKAQKGPEDIMFFKQTIGNACGTMGILHAVANIPVTLDPSTPLAKLFADCKPLSPAERGKYLETSKAIEAAHTSSAQGGQTAAPTADEEVDLHFSCFVAAEVGGEQKVVELDGRRPAPVVHSPVNGDLLTAVAGIVKEYIAVSENINFNLIALTKPQ